MDKAVIVLVVLTLTLTLLRQIVGSCAQISGHPISNVILLDDFEEIKNTHKILI